MVMTNTWLQVFTLLITINISHYPFTLFHVLIRIEITKKQGKTESIIDPLLHYH